MNLGGVVGAGGGVGGGNAAAEVMETQLILEYIAFGFGLFSIFC